jgi:hypothetical protein
VLAAKLPGQHPFPIAGEALVAHPPDFRVLHRLGAFVIAKQLGAVIRVARPLELQSPPRADHGEERPHLVLEAVQPRGSRPAQVRWLQPETFCGDAATLG